MDTILRANDRAQRRFRRMVMDQCYADPTARATRLYVQAERLMDRLRGEVESFELTPARFEAQLGALFDATNRELNELQENDGLPDIPLAESEMRWAWGDR